MADAADSKPPAAPLPSAQNSDVRENTPGAVTDVTADERGADVTGQPRGEEPGPTDPVEAALADALSKAAAAGQWTAVEALSRELGARREARAKVILLDAARRQRKG